MKRSIVLLLLVFAIITSVPGQSRDPKQVLQTLFVSGADAVAYTDQFANAVSESRLESILEQITAQLGAFREVQSDGNPYTLLFEEGTATAVIHLSDEGAVAGLRFTRITPAAADLSEAADKLRALPGEVSVLVRADGRARIAHNADTPLAVGSTFKLAVLAAVQEAVAEGGVTWEQVLRLEPKLRSLPSGILQDWPEGSAVTVETLATLMISQSDNTATDALIRLVGRSAVEEFAPHTVPFLTTREAFVLKDPENAELRARYLAGSEDERRELLESVAGRGLPEASLFTGQPVAPEIEWFFTTGELCSLMNRVAGLDLTTVNPGVADPQAWQRVSYKGGSEPGVLNLTTRLLAKDGTSYCVSVTQNRDTPIDETAFYAAYQGLLGALRK
jgi:beta-lactamase class A